MGGLNSKTTLNLIIILFSVLTIITLKDDVFSFFEDFNQKNIVVENVSPSLSKTKNSLCMPPEEMLRKEIEDKEGTMDTLYEEITNIKYELEKPYAPYTTTYKSDVEYYNQKVSEFNTLRLNVETLIGKYNAQVEDWSNCQK